jgi:hypothetical protein
MAKISPYWEEGLTTEGKILLKVKEVWETSRESTPCSKEIRTKVANYLASPKWKPCYMHHS